MMKLSRTTIQGVMFALNIVGIFLIWLGGSPESFRQLADSWQGGVIVISMIALIALAAAEMDQEGAFFTDVTWLRTGAAASVGALYFAAALPLLLQVTTDVPVLWGVAVGVVAVTAFVGYRVEQLLILQGHREFRKFLSHIPEPERSALAGYAIIELLQT